MTLLAKIRNRAGLLVAIIGIALLTFILQSALESGNMFFASNDRNIGEIAGNSVSYDEFNAKVQEAIENRKKAMNVTTLDEQVVDDIVDRQWSQVLQDRIMGEEYKALGISVSPEELTDIMLGNNPHPYIVQYFTDRSTGKVYDQYLNPATGQINMQKVLEYNQQMDAQAEADWVQLENAIRESRMIEKYNNLIKKGIYVTSAQAKSEYVDENKLYSIRYTVKKYFTVPDSAVKVTDEEIKAYYAAHPHEFRNTEETRSADYVVFNAEPSEEDMKALITDVNRIRDEFAKTSGKDDSAFVIRESDGADYNNVYLRKGQLSEAVDTVVFKDSIKPGVVVGPYSENNMFKVTKLIDKKMSSDSAKASHILVAYKGLKGALPNVTRTPEQARKRADSLVKVLKAMDPKKMVAEFKNLAKNQNDDMVAAGTEGDLGWMTPEARFDEIFKDKCFDIKKGDVGWVETQFGFHVIYISEKGAETPRVKLATVKRAIGPSSKTLQTYYLKASEFAGKNPEGALFDKAAADQKLNKRVAEDIKQNDRSIGGLEDPKELIRWMYEEKVKVGDVSSAMEFNNKFVVARLTQINPKGILPLENAKVKTQAETGAKQDKKAVMFAAELEKALAGSRTIEDVGTKAGLPVQNSENFSFTSAAVIGLGREGELAGIIATSKKGVMTKPVKGKAGVFVAVVEEVKEPVATSEYKPVKARVAENIQGRVEYEVFEALKENANVSDKRARFF